MQPIIESLLDTDFYKLTMMQAIYHKYTDVEAEYAFKWRNWHKMHLNIPVHDFITQLNEQIDNLCSLNFKDQELTFLEQVPFLTKDFVEFLKLFKLNRNHIYAYVNNGEPSIRIKGPWLNTILFEVPVLAIVSELYTDNNGIDDGVWTDMAMNNLSTKLSWLNSKIDGEEPFYYGDFGTRRRASRHWQDCLIDMQLNGKHKPRLIGTSNVLLAMKYNIPYLGTQAHEWFQMHQQLDSRLIDSQKAALQAWANEYRGDLGIALTDCITFDGFLMDFDKYFAKLFDGCRHDSGDPYAWAERLINHYKRLEVDPRTKTALFSDGLNFETALDIYQQFKNRINPAFGIGTYLTNDCGFTAPQIVIKTVRCNELPVAKVSDSPGKGMCEDIEFLNYLKKVIGQKTGKTGIIEET